MLVAPLPDASALVVFRDLAAEAAGAAAARAGRDAALDDLALEQLRAAGRGGGAEARWPRSRRRQSPEAFQALGAAAQGLKDGLARAARAARAGRRRRRAGDGPLPELAAALAARGLTLDAAAPTPPPGRRSCAAPRSRSASPPPTSPRPARAVALALDDERRAAPADRDAPPPAAAPARPRASASALARRVVEAAGGSLRASRRRRARVTLAADLPARRGAPAAARRDRRCRGLSRAGLRPPRRAL